VNEKVQAEQLEVEKAQKRAEDLVDERHRLQELLHKANSSLSQAVREKNIALSQTQTSLEDHYK
jgi:hypothetical protein